MSTETSIPESQDSGLICASCLQQVFVFYTIKKTSSQNSYRFKQFNAMFKETNNFKYNELSELIIKSNSEEVSTELKHNIDIKVEPNHEDLFLSEDTDPTHVMKEEKVYDCNNQQLENEESTLNYLQDDGPCSSRNINTQNQRNVRDYEFVDVKKFTDKDSNLTSNNSRCEDEPKNQLESEEKKFKCTDCHKEFTKRSNLERHSRVHTGEKPHKCEVCQKTFTQRVHLTTHKLTHTGAKPHECDVCHKTFIQKNELITHKRLHNNVRPFQYSLCSKTFTSCSQRNRHKRSHTGEKPHQCHLCQFKCTNTSALKVHIRVHTGEKPYSCKHCDKSFRTSGDLKRHERRLHSNEDSN